MRDGGESGCPEHRGATRYSYCLVFVLLVFLAVAVVRNLLVPVNVDEANWLMQTRHLGAGYFLHPPFIVYQQYVITRLFGCGPFALRIGSLLFTSGSVVLVYALSTAMFGVRRRALCAALLFAVLPATTYWLMTGHQDAPLVFFFLSGVLLTWKALETGRGRYWYLAGLAAGLMLLCNLRAVFFPVGVFLVLVSSPAGRGWLRRKEPYVALGIAVLVFLPTLVWYALKNFEPVTYQLTNRAGFLEGGLLEYLRKVFVHAGWEGISLTPLAYLFSLFGVFGAGWLGLRKKDEALALLFWFSAPMIIFFTLTGGQPYWALPASVISLVAAVEYMSRLLWHDFAGIRPRNWKVASLALFVALALVVSLLVNVFFATGSVHAGWDELSEAVTRVREASFGKGDAYFASPYYFISSQVAYYQGDGFPGYTVAFNAYESPVCRGGGSRYSPWTPLDRLVGKDVVFVDEKRNPDGYDTPVGYWERKLRAHFSTVGRPVVFNLQGGSRTFYIFACRGFKGCDRDADCRGEVRRYLLESSRQTMPDVD